MADNEVAIPAPAQMIARYHGVLADILPSHLSADTFVRLCTGALRRNPDLLHAATVNAQSFIGAVMEAARLGHEPATDHFALTVRGKGQAAQVVGIEQYQGVIDRMYRAGAVQTVVANIVMRNDNFEWDGINPPKHVADWLELNGPRGDMVAVYAFAKLDSGQTSRVVVLPKSEVMKHRAAAATTKIWDAWPISMWLKTAVHELEKWVPTTAEYRRAVAAGARLDAAGVPAPVPSVVYPATVEAASDDLSGPEVAEVIDASGGDEWPEVRQPGGESDG